MEGGIRSQGRLKSSATKFGWVAILVLLAVGLGWWFVHQSGKAAKQVASSPSASVSPAPTSASPAADQKSIAVLPFANMSADKADEYLSDGMTEELLNVLAKVKGLRVPGRSSSFAFKGKNEPDIFRTVGEQLHVRTVLEGSVRKAGNQLRITAQLINVADGFHLWSETYDRDMTNIFAIQSEIAARVAQALKVQLLGAVEPRKKPTESLEAYKSYLQGRQLWNRRSGEALTEAIGYFNRAIAADSTFALAYSGVADCYAVMPAWTGLPQRETAPKGRAAALKAIELDERLGEPDAALAFIKANYDWDWRGAEAGFRRAIELNANYATAHLWFGSVLEKQRRFDEALAEFQRAQEIDPLSPSVIRSLGFALFEAGKEDLGVQALQQQIALDPGFSGARQLLGIIYLKQGKLSEAILELDKNKLASGKTGFDSGLCGFAYARAGRTNDAQKVLVQLLDLQRQARDASLEIEIAYVQHGLRNDAQALDWLERAAAEHVWRLNELNQWPLWDDLRPHPRAQAILRKMNLVK